MLTKILHDITQWGYEVTFNSDFEGMITITYKKEVNPSKDEGYIRHEHVSYPGSSEKELEKAVLTSLTRFLEEVKDGKSPQKDGLAK